MELKQQRLAIRIQSQIFSDGVLIKYKDLFNETKTIISFENISNQMVTSYNIPKLYIIICVFFCFIFLFNLYDFFIGTSTKYPAELRDIIMSFMWFSLAALGTWMRGVKYIEIVCDTTNLVFMDLKGKQNPRRYIDSIFTARNKYFEYQESLYKYEDLSHTNGIKETLH